MEYLILEIIENKNKNHELNVNYGKNIKIF